MQVLNPLKLKILTPDGIFFNDNIEIVSVKTTEGNIGILHGHIPLIASIAISQLHINDPTSNNYRKCAISGGLLCVKPTEVTIITDTIEYQDDIDLSRAERAQKLAEKILQQKNIEAPIEALAHLALSKALNRIKLKSEK